MNISRLKEKMRIRGIRTQADLAKAIGVSPASISRWFRDQRQIKLNDAVKISKELRLEGYEILEIFFGA